MCDECGSAATVAREWGCGCAVCRTVGRMDEIDRLRLEDAANLYLIGEEVEEVERAKAKNPLVHRHFLRLEKTLADSLRAVATEEGNNAMLLLGQLLDERFDVTPAYAQYMIEQIATAYPGFGEAIAKASIPITVESATEVIALTRKAMAALPALSKLPKEWADSFELRDQRAIEAIGRKPALWIGDYYKGPLVEKARAIIEKSMELGLGREQTAGLLETALGSSFKDYRYFDVVASSVTSRARGWSAISSMGAAGFDTYGILPVGDEVTCSTCLALSKHEFKVEKAVATMESMFGIEDPEEVRAKTPWLQWDDSEDAKDAYYLKGDKRVYIGNMGAAGLQNAGLGILPVHGRCYSEDTEVYTDSGWKLFSALHGQERILSLNPDTFELEWLPFTKLVANRHDGQMLSFRSRWFDLLATPDHDQLYGYRIMRKGKRRKVWKIAPLGSLIGKDEVLFPRTAEWSGEEIAAVNIGELAIPADTFCRFMAYWLSDGSVTKRSSGCYQISIAKEGKKQRQMIEGIADMPVKVDVGNGKLYLFSKPLGEYLMQFGKSPDKYVPDIIKGMSRRLVRIFLEAYSIGDGHVKRTHWKERGVESEGRVYFTSSRRMADDLGELILKAGGHPSFRTDKTAGKVQEFKNGTYTINNDLIVIAWRRSKTAHWGSSGAVKCEEVEYHGMVWDVELPRNHVLWVRRNGKTCFSGNCRCVPILIEQGA